MLDNVHHFKFTFIFKYFFEFFTLFTFLYFVFIAYDFSLYNNVFKFTNFKVKSYTFQYENESFTIFVYDWFY